MKMPPAAKEFLEDFISLFYPRVCVHCEGPLVAQEEHLCTACRLSLPKTDYHRVTDNPLYQKFAFETTVKAVSAYLHFNKGGIAQSIIHELKYRGNTDLGEFAGKLYGSELRQIGWPLDIIIPVPLHPSKLKKRGYNQSEHFGIGLSEVLAVPMKTDAVRRIRKTTSQTKKSKVARWQNMDAVYSVVDLSAVIGKNVLLVDDVLTTGATIGELATLLAAHGAKGIYVVTIAAGR